MSARRIALAVDAVCALIVASVAIALAGLTWRLAGDPGHGPRAAVSVAPPAPAIDLTSILALAPFGRVAPTALSPAGGLELRGILLAQPRSASTVLVSFGGGPAQSFGIGQTLPSGATVDAVALDHVVLRTGARTELLGFPNPGGAPMDAPDPGSPDPGGTAAPAAFGPFQPPPGAPPSPAANPTAFLDTLGVAATDGGYRIGVNPSSAMRLAGLLPGDVIERVNGTQVGNVALDSGMLDQAFRTGGARVEVLRGDRRITLSFPSR